MRRRRRRSSRRRRYRAVRLMLSLAALCFEKIIIFYAIWCCCVRVCFIFDFRLSLQQHSDVRLLRVHTRCKHCVVYIFELNTIDSGTLIYFIYLYALAPQRSQFCFCFLILSSSSASAVAAAAAVAVDLTDRQTDRQKLLFYCFGREYCKIIIQICRVSKTIFNKIISSECRRK